MRNCFLLYFCFLLNIGLSQKLHQPYPDNSFSIETYYELGIPSLDQPWKSAEYEEAIIVLQATHEIDKWALPRKNSLQSKALFNKLTDTDNLDILTNSSFSLKIRVNELGRFPNYIEELLELYIEKDEPIERFGTEYLALLEFSAYYAQNAMLLVEEIKSLLPKEKQTSTDFLLTYRTVQGALADNIRILISTIGNKHHRFLEQDLSLFLQNSEKIIGESWTLMNESEQNDIIDSIKKVGKKHSNKEIRKQFKKLYKKLK